MRIPALLVLALAACACPHNPPAARPEPEALELAGAGVELASWTLHVSADLARDNGQAAACATLEAFAGLGHAVAGSLAGEASGSVTYGELVIDASACGDLALDKVEIPGLVSGNAARLIGAVRAQVGAFRLTCEDAARVEGALGYLQGATGPILDALQAGELKITIPAYSAPLAPCQG